MDLKKLAIGFAACASFLMGAPSAHASFAINFERMEINDCKEFGSCDWNLQCFLAPSQMAEIGFGKVEADSGDTVSINQTLQVNALPASIQCHVQEWDGGIGASWQEVGWDRKEIRLEELIPDPASGTFTGSYVYNISNNEGDVSILVYVRGAP